MGDWGRNKDPTFCDKSQFDDPTKMELGNTLAQKLIPVADNVRNLYTKFGMRAYKVRVVKVRWSGERRGQGVPQIAATIDLLPTPRVMDLSTMTEILNPIGLDESGSIVISEISGRFTDDQLRLVDDDGEGPAPNEEVFYEIEYPQPNGARSTSIKRRFSLRSAPDYSPGRFQWTLRLERANEDRTRQGDPR